MDQEDQIISELLRDADKFLDDVASDILALSQERLVSNESIDTGLMLRSGFVNRKWLEKEVGYSAPYASVIEYGSHPHMPPVEPLIKWAKRKIGLSEKEAEQAGWRIAKKIAKEGTLPKPFFRPAIEVAIRNAKAAVKS